MFKRLLVGFAITLIPGGLVLALPNGPVSTDSTFTVQNTLMDSMVTSGTTKDNSAQGLLGYTMTFHNNTYQYSLPVCRDAVLVDVNNQAIDKAGFNVNDALVVTARPNSLAAAKSCISRVVRQTITRGASGGECLQNYQVGHSIVGAPSPLVVKQEYTYKLTAHARPTLDCDASAYGTTPITTVVAGRTPFVVTASRTGTNGDIPLMTWNLTTDTAGQASFVYTFNLPSDSYKFTIAPATNATPGDTISWTQKVTDPNPATPLPTPTATSSIVKLSAWPFVVVLLAVLIVAIVFDVRHYVLKKRERQTPEEEYNRTSGL